MITELLFIGKPVYEENNIYFVSGSYSALFVVNSENWKVEWLCDIEWLVKGSSADCYKIDHKIYCVSNKAVQIAIYDLTDGTLEMRSFMDVERKNVYSLNKEQKIWFFPVSFLDELVCFDIAADEFIECMEWKVWVEKEKLKGCAVIAAQKETEVTMTIIDSNSFIRTKYPFKEFVVENLPVDEKLFCVFYGEKKIYFSSKESYSIFSLDTCGNFSKNQFQIDGEGYFQRGFFCGKELIITSGNQVYSVRNGVLRNIKVPDLSSTECAGSLFIHRIENANCFILLPWTSIRAMIIDKKQEEFTSLKLELSNSRWLKDTLIMNEGDIGLLDFIDYLSTMECKNYIQNDNTLVGQNIFQKLCGDNKYEHR